MWAKKYSLDERFKYHRAKMDKDMYSLGFVYAVLDKNGDLLASKGCREREKDKHYQAGTQAGFNARVKAWKLKW